MEWLAYHNAHKHAKDCRCKVKSASVLRRTVIPRENVMVIVPSFANYEVRYKLIVTGSIIPSYAVD